MSSCLGSCTPRSFETKKVCVCVCVCVCARARVVRAGDEGWVGGAL